MSRARIILNGKSAGRPDVREAVSTLREQGAHLEVRVTWEAGDVDRLTAESLNDNVEMLVAAGGDGTLHELVNALFHRTDSPQLSVGILPLGTANDFATSCGVPLDPVQALELILQSEPIGIDVGKCNQHYFVNVASGGLGAEITSSTPPEMKRVLGGGAYSLVGLVSALKWKPYPVKVTGPDTELDCSAVIAAVCNGWQAGGGYLIAPQARLDDGMLDILVIQEFPVTDLGVVLDEIQRPELGNGNRYVFRRQLEQCAIVCPRETPFNLDGEPLLEKEYQFNLMKGALAMRLPARIEETEAGG